MASFKGQNVRVMVDGKAVHVGTAEQLHYEVLKQEPPEEPIQGKSWDLQCECKAEEGFDLVQFVEEKINRSMPRILVECKVVRIPRKTKKELRKYKAGDPLTRRRYDLFRFFRRNYYFIEGERHFSQKQEADGSTTITVTMDNPLIKCGWPTERQKP